MPVELVVPSVGESITISNGGVYGAVVIRPMMYLIEDPARMLLEI